MLTTAGDANYVCEWALHVSKRIDLNGMHTNTFVWNTTMFFQYLLVDLTLLNENMKLILSNYFYAFATCCNREQVNQKLMQLLKWNLAQIMSIEYKDVR